MRRKTIIILIMIVLITSLPACENNEKIIIKTQENIESSSLETEDSNEDDLEKNYEWVVTPTIEAEDIIVFDTSYIPKHGTPKFREYNVNIEDDDYTETMSHDKYAIIKKDGKYGFVGYDGKILAEPKYERYGSHYCGALYISKNMENSFLKTDGKLTVGDSMCGDGWFNIEYKKEENVFVRDYYEEYLNELDVAVPVIEKNDLSWFHGENKGKYGIYYQGKLIVDYEYDDYICQIQANDQRVDKSYSFAMKKDGDWYLFDGKGNRILEESCDVIESNSYSSNDDTMYPYLFTEGVCAILQNGQMRYIDMQGNDVMPAGEFEELRPVYNSMAWVKQNGKWGVIKLKKTYIQEDSEVETTIEIPIDISKNQETNIGNFDNTVDVYKNLIEQYKTKYPNYNAGFANHCKYYMYDFEQDGIFEILIETGTCEQDRKITVYTNKNGKAFEMGSFISMHMMLYASDDFSNHGLAEDYYDYHDLYGFAKYPGADAPSAVLSQIYIEDNTVVLKQIEGATSAGNSNLLKSYKFDNLSGIEKLEEN